ncbi:MAG: right-handed parallel beta-helix repeat-containing protein [Planctomycetota bacterium]|nr:right-handed parallel beta-helix repeat-containing protein [Planctomycetota bacterium]
MQATLSSVLIRKVRTAVHVAGRARNLRIGQCHFYNNTGVGVHFDRVNLHQAIITGSHISYCRLGGVRIEDSEVRNLQITGNDIEYNNNKAHKVPGADAEPTAEILIDCRGGSIREGTIASNTLQATYSPGGSNIRMIGAGPDKNHKVGLFTISGNLIGSQENNIHLTSVRGVAISGNVIYSGHSRNLLLEHCRNIVVGSNVFDHNPDYEPNELCTGIRLVDSVDCSLSGLVIQDCQAGRHTVKDAGPQERQALLELERCRRISVTGSQILEGAPVGIALNDCADVLIQGCSILDGRATPLMQHAIRWTGEGSGNLISQCRLGGTAAAIDAPKHVRRWNILEGA